MNLLYLFLVTIRIYGAPIDCQNQLLTADQSEWGGSRQELLQGYWYDCYWVDGLVDVQSYSETPVHFETRALWQRRGLMEQTASYNGVPVHDIIGGIALAYCGDVARQAYVRAPHLGYSEWVIARVADCVNPIHAAYHIVYLRSGLELDYELAQRIGVTEWRSPSGGIGPSVEVCLTNGNPYSECMGTPVNYSEWWITIARYW